MTVAANRRNGLTLYVDAADLAGHAVRLVLAEKALKVEIIYVTPQNRPEDLNDLNPYHQILTLLDRDLVLYDPPIMLEYLDERYPHPPLMPTDPISRASNRQFRRRVSRELLEVADAVAGATKAQVKEATRVIRDNLHAIAPIFSHRKFFMSDEYSLVDCCLAPLLWRLPHFGIQLEPQAKPLARYAESLFGREAFKASLSAWERGLNTTVASLMKPA
jgi:RNA polymerase-associated protein